MRKNACNKFFEFTHSHGVTSNKSKSASLICYIHQQDLCTHTTLFYGNHVKLRKGYQSKTTDISPKIYLLKVVIKTCYSRLYVTVYCKKLTVLWIFTKCIHYGHRKHLRGKQQRPLKEPIVPWTVLERISNLLEVIGKNVKNASDISHNKNPKV